jgi:hypothetical protein
MKKCLEVTYGNEKCLLDPKTGEVLNYEGRVIYIQTEEERDRTRKYFKDLKEREEQAKVINEKYKDYGNFIWNVYNLNQQSFPQLKASNITRLMFLSTYLNYDGFLMFNQRTIMTKENMFKLLKLSDREFRSFYKDMIDNNILYLNEDNIYINENMFGKGKLRNTLIAKFSEEEKYITRLYIDGVRDLYDKSTPRSHKTLSYLFQILPYVNRQYNIVCYNPLEEDLKEIQGMSLGQFCETIGYSNHNSSQLFRYLFEPQFTINGKLTTAMRYVVDKGLDKSTYSMYINPRVYYAGNRWHEVEVLAKF